MKDSYDSLSDQELSDLVAVEIAGWTCCSTYLQRQAFPRPWVDANGHPQVDPVFAVSADATLPLLERAGWRGVGNRCGSTCASTIEVLADPHTGVTVIAQADYTTTQTPFPRAACLALLRANDARKATASAGAP